MEDPVLEYRILNAVHEQQEQLTQRGISEKVGRSVASVNFAIRLLAAKGLIKISGVNPRRLFYHVTPQGLVQKSVLAYRFLKQQCELYEEVRTEFISKLGALGTEGVKTAGVYGWTPFTESAVLCLILEGVEVSALYVREMESFSQWNRIPCKLIDEFEEDCDVLVLMEPLPKSIDEKISVRKIVCHPESQ